MTDDMDLGCGSGWWIILLFLFIMGGWNNYGNGSGAMENYVLNSDFATLSRQLDSGIDRLAQQGNQIANGLCDGFYTQAQLVNGVNQNITNAEINAMQNANALQSQLASCCCENKTAIADLKASVNQGFCNTNYNMQNLTRDITDNANANTKQIMDFLVQDKISTLQSENESLRLQASQVAQNNYLVNALRPSPIPAYPVANPYAVNTCNCPYT